MFPAEVEQSLLVSASGRDYGRLETGVDRQAVALGLLEGVGAPLWHVLGVRPQTSRSALLNLLCLPHSKKTDSTWMTDFRIQDYNLCVVCSYLPFLGAQYLLNSCLWRFYYYHEK